MSKSKPVTRYGIYFPIVLFNLILSCTPSVKPSMSLTGILELKMKRYQQDGSAMFEVITKVWYRDRSVVQDIREVRMSTVSGKESIETPVTGYLYINLRKKLVYEYSSFSDTARILKQYPLPAERLDKGWSFYSAKILQINSNPEVLGDTIMNNVSYRKMKFHFDNEDPDKNFTIGYLRYDGRGTLFSLEKDYCGRTNCTMTKLYSYKVGAPYPYGSQEIRFVADTLTSGDQRVFDTWDRNVK